MSQANDLIQHVRTNGLRLRAETESDGQLLDRFLTSRDQAAFEALMARLGPMVWSVCRRMLGEAADAEDAFQATFMVLVRKGRTVSPRDRVGNWLYGVAYHAARKARVDRARRREKEHRAASMAKTHAFDPTPTSDLTDCIDREVSRLPEKYRAPVVLCDLEGKTREEAARHLGWPEGTVAGRLSRARDLLARRLGRYSLGVSPVAIAATLSESAGAQGPPAAVLLSARQAALGLAVSPRALALMDSVLRTMVVRKVQGVAIGLVFVLAAGGLAVPFVFQRPAPIVKNVVADDNSKDQPAPPTDPVAELQKKLAGRWQVDAGVRNGQALTAWEKRGYLIDFGADGILWLHRGLVRERRTYGWVIEPDPVPRKVVLTPPDGVKANAFPMTCELKDDRLTLTWDEAAVGRSRSDRGAGIANQLTLSRHEPEGGMQVGLRVAAATENVVGSRLAGTWEADEELARRLGDSKWTVIQLKITVDPNVAAEVSDAYRPMFAGKRIYLAGRMQVKPCKDAPETYPFLLVEHLGNPLLVYFLPQGPDVCVADEAVTVMLAPAADRKGDLLFLTAFDKAKHAPVGGFRRVADEK